MSGVLTVAVALPLLIALVMALLRPAARRAAVAAVIASAVSFLAAVAVLVATAVDGPTSAVVTDSDGRAVLGLAADRVGAVLITLTMLVGLVVQSFASRSLLGDPRASRFHVLSLVLTSATATVAVAATGSGLLIAWIVTSLALVALIGHRSPWPPAIAAQRRTGLSFLIGDLALFLAVVATVATIGDVDLRAVAADATALDAEQIMGINAVTVIAVLLVVAGVARSALVPIHRWLPSTLAAPTPVSALLHAGVVNGAGVLLIRFSPLFGASATAMTLAFVLGMATALIATAVMLVRTDVKGGLVWSTSGQMGFMVLQLGVGAFAAALFHIVGHALYKATMFLGAGGAITTHQRQGTRPHLGEADATTLRSPIVRVLVGLAVPLVAFALALLVVDPHLTSSATILIVVFGTLSIGRAANGWMGSTPFGVRRSIVTAVVGVFVGVFAYVGGLTLFENFVADVVPYDVPAAVGPVWVAATLAVIAVAVAVIVFAPGTGGDALRRRTYAWLFSTGTATPISPARRRARSAPEPAPCAATSDSPIPVTVGEPA